MNRLICVGVLSAMMASVFCESAIATPPDTRADAEGIAGKLKFFATGEFLDDRHDFHFHKLPPDVIKEYVELLGPLSDKQYPVEAWVALLKHPNARVRTLALAALFVREDPKLLPHLAALLKDKAPTFSQPPLIYDAFVVPKFDPKALKEQTVGEVAGQMIGFYLWLVGIDLQERNPTPAEFKSYWDARKDRSHCASWYGVQLARASQRTWPVARERTERIRAVRAKIDKLPAVERAWVLLWLLEQPGCDILVSDEELVAAAKQLGPDRLLGLLRREADTDDPDWRHPQKQGTWLYMLATRFVLKNAGKLLRPEDAQTLLNYEFQELQSVSKGNISPNLTAFWAIGAAQLQPAKAKTILHDAFGRYQASYQKRDRTQLGLALWRTGGLAESKFLLDWFYREVPGLGESGEIGGRPAFLHAVPGLRPPDDRKLVAAIVRDKRFDSLDWESLERLIEVLNGWTKEPVVDREGLRKAWHPFGISHFTPAWRQKAENEYPQETQELLKTLQIWRSAVRESLPRWEQPPAGTFSPTPTPPGAWRSMRPWRVKLHNRIRVMARNRNLGPYL